jgi:hypothetical protein
MKRIAIRSVLASIMAMCVAPGYGAAVATFDGPSGTYDTYPGTAGGGWQGGWGINNINGGSAVATLTNTTPINGGGNYLRFTTTTNTFPSTVGRRLDTSLASEYTAQHRWTADLRIDALAPNDQAIWLVTNAENSPTASSSRVGAQIRTGYNATTGTHTWFIGNGNSDGVGANVTFVNSNIAAVAGSVYRFTIDANPASGTYDVLINGANVDVNATTPNFRYRANAADALLQNGILFRVDRTATTFSIDNVSFAAVPEPMSLGALACFGMGLLARHRRATAV